MKVYVHGNCQAPILHRLITDLFPEWDVSSYEVFSHIITDEIDKYREKIRQSDVILSQHIWHGYRDVEELSTQWIAQNKSSNAPLITFPSLFFRGLHPAIHYLRENGGEFSNFGMPYQDITLLYLYSMGKDDRDLINLMCSPDLYSETFVRGEFERSIDELRRRENEDHLTVKLAQWLSANASKRQLFHTINHPNREVMAFIVNSILSVMGVDRRASIEGVDFLNTPHIPPCPSVIRNLGISDEVDQSSFLIEGVANPIMRREYYERSIETISDRSRQSIYELIHGQNETSEFLTRLQADGIDRYLT